MYTLTKEQKIANLEERRSNLQSKITNLQKEIAGIEGKICKLKDSENRSSSERNNTTVLPTLVQQLPLEEQQKWMKDHNVL